jgi:hypothetical protein
MTNIQWHIRPELLLKNKKILELCEALNLDPERDFLESAIKTLDTPTSHKTISTPASTSYKSPNKSPNKSININTSSCDFTTYLAWELIEITQLSYSPKSSLNNISENNISEIKLYENIEPKDFKIIFASIEKKLREIFNKNNNHDDQNDQPFNTNQIEKIIKSIDTEILEKLDQIDNQYAKELMQDQKLKKSWTKHLKQTLNKDKKTLESRNQFFSLLNADLSNICQISNTERLKKDIKKDLKKDITELALTTQRLLAEQMHETIKQAERFEQFSESLFIDPKIRTKSNTYGIKYESEINSLKPHIKPHISNTQILMPLQIINHLSHLNQFGLHATFNIKKLLTDQSIQQQDIDLFNDLNKKTLLAQIQEYLEFRNLMPNDDMAIILDKLDQSEKALSSYDQIKPLKDLEYFYKHFSSEQEINSKQILDKRLNQLTPAQIDSLKKLLPISKHKKIIENLYNLKDDIISINEDSNLQKNALQLKLNLFELQKSLISQLIGDITLEITRPITESDLDLYKTQNNLRKIFSTEYHVQIKYLINDIIEDQIKSEENNIFCNQDTKILEDLIYKKLEPLISKNNLEKLPYKNTSKLIAKIIINKNNHSPESSSYNKVICDLNNNIKLFKPKDIKTSSNHLESIERSLTCPESQAVLRQNYESRKLIDTILKNIRGIIIACTIIPVLVAGAIYVIQPKINGHRYKNFWSIWSGIKNGKFTNHTKSKDFALSMRSMINEFNSKKQINNQAAEMNIEIK